MKSCYIHSRKDALSCMPYISFSTLRSRRDVQGVALCALYKDGWKPNTREDDRSEASERADFREVSSDRRDRGRDQERDRDRDRRESSGSRGEGSRGFSGGCRRQISRSNSRSRSRSISRSASKPSHVPVWSAIVLNEPVFLASGRGKEEFSAQLVVDVVPSLGTSRAPIVTSLYSTSHISFTLCSLLFCFGLLYCCPCFSPLSFRVRCFDLSLPWRAISGVECIPPY